MSNVLKKGIDVSSWQGNIDWEKVSKEIDFVIIRAGARNSIDSKLDQNVKGCEKYGIPYGFYWYSYALDEDESLIEAKTCYSAIKNYHPSYPVFLDQEDPSQSKLGKSNLSGMANTFCEYIKSKGFYPGFYGYLAWVNGIVGDVSKWDLWVAQWASKCTCTKPYTMWQYSNKGRINGITGDVDLDYCYVDYDMIINNSGTKEDNLSHDISPEPAESTTKKSIDELVVEIWQGKWSNGEERKKRLLNSGYSYTIVQNAVDEVKKVANDVWAGKYGNGDIRKLKLESAGYKYSTIQAIVNLTSP